MTAVDHVVVWQVMERIHAQFQTSTSEVAALPLHGLSAKTGEGAQDLLPAAMQLYDTWNKRLTTSRLNNWREKVIQAMQWFQVFSSVMCYAALVLMKCLVMLPACSVSAFTCMLWSNGGI